VTEPTARPEDWSEREGEPTSPKIELHVHLEGAIRPHTLLDIARRNGETLPADTVDGLAALYEFTDFAHFIDVWILTTNCLRNRSDFHQIVVDYAEEAAGFGAVYIEAIMSPGERMERGVDPHELFAGYLDGADEALERFGVTVRFTPDLHRGLDPALSEQVARLCVEYADRGVVGLGLGGLETRPAAYHKGAFDIARAGGLALVPHAGESAGPESIRDVLALEPDRIRHGIRAIDDPALMADLVERGIVLDVCVTSNLRTGVVASLDQHPLPKLRAAGVQCTVNTDDPAMFGTDLGREYAIAASLGVSAAEAYAAGLAGCVCDDLTRAMLAEIGLTAYQLS
jgi:aminodeoxyfutalosine deaminase